MEDQAGVVQEGVTQRESLDPLTGLYNMQTFLGKLRQVLEDWTEGPSGASDDPTSHSQDDLTVIYFDISSFKAVNLERGLQAGDQILIGLAGVIQQVADRLFAARDGAHFYLVCPYQSAQHTIGLVHETMEHDPRYSVNVRAGIYVLTGAEDSANLVLDRVRLAGDVARGDFRHYWRLYTPDMETIVSTRSYLVGHVDEAIQQGWLKVYYQPVVDTLSGKISSCEALVRWVDPTYGFLNPAAFIATLEDARIIHKVDLYVLDVVCADLANGIKTGRALAAVSLNLSRRDLEVKDIHETINDIVESHQIPHDRIRFEITETALLEDDLGIRDHIQLFHDDGYQVWLDDFGSGYSSLNTLHEYDLDCVKIDMHFLHHRNDRTRTILSSIVDLSKRLGMSVLAEGVETSSQREYLADIGCTYLQGYLYSKPLPILELIAETARAGLEVESPADRLFYSHLAKVNILDVQGTGQGARSDAQAKVPVSIVEVENRTLRTAYANPACRALLGRAGMGDTEKADDRANTELFARRKAVLGCMRKAARTGEVAELDFVSAAHAGRLRFQNVYTHDHRRAYLITYIDTSVSMEGKGAQLYLQDLYTLFDDVVVLAPALNRFYHVYGDNDLGDRPSGSDLKEYQGALLSTGVPPEERERMRSFLDLESLESRVAAAPNQCLNGYFHFNLGRGGYEWKRLLICRVPSDGANARYLMCVCRNNVSLGGDDVAKVLPEKLVPPRESPEGASLHFRARDWLPLLDQLPFGLFWCDSSLVFRWASRTFLQACGVEADEVVGKTVELAPLPTALVQAIAADSFDVSHSSKPTSRLVKVRDVNRTNLPRGAREDLVSLTCLPFRHPDMAPGIIGVVVDRSGESIDAIKGTAEILSESMIGGALANLSHRERAYADEGVDYAFIVVQVAGLERFGRDYGRAAQGRLVAQVQSLIGETVGPHATLSHLSLSRLAVSLPLAAEDDVLAKVQIHTLCQRIADALASIHWLDDIPCTLYGMVGGALRTECADALELTLLAERRIMEKDRVTTSTRQLTADTLVPFLRQHIESCDIVRVVDPLTMQATALAKDGQPYQMPGRCHNLLNKSERCQNCISLRTAQTMTPERKVEVVGDKHYFITSQYVEIDGQPRSLERITLLDGDILDDLRDRPRQGQVIP